ncbi:polyadenylation/uridylation factor 1 [Trypanosoma grayi]|uniref:polyadenylation/uridylation factor 1 n=1 Tax=Trypanosoma grayi TaxID=71804 RepID=UPI0004F47650|nr:polyadenylation/uridylation factor 1 [Trypanosoma grayi]KEG09235.1 polyadenylation/uridylation factor 1 [Trypanosoma grayi]
MARGYAKVGRFDKTVETLHLLRDRNWVPDAATALSLSSAFLKAGLHEQAQQIVQWRRQYAKHAGEEAPTAADI